MRSEGMHISPLIHEYLREGLVASLSAEVQPVRDQIEGIVDDGTWTD